MNFAYLPRKSTVNKVARGRWFPYFGEPSLIASFYLQTSPIQTLFVPMRCAILSFQRTLCPRFGEKSLLTSIAVTHQQRDDFGFHKPWGVCLGQAPYIAPELFIGRSAELDQIAEILHPVQDLQKQQRLVLGGMGGIGKTRLAIAYAESQSRSYSSVFWLNAASEAALKDSFQSVARLIFDIQDSGLLESKEMTGRVLQWLSDPVNTGWLLIFDNYDDPTQFDINDFYPPASHGSIVVTTRSPDHVTGSTLHIRPFQDIKDGLAILQTRSKRENVQSGMLHTDTHRI